MQHDSLRESYSMCDVIPGNFQSIAQVIFFQKEPAENVDKRD